MDEPPINYTNVTVSTASVGSRDPSVASLELVVLAVMFAAILFGNVLVLIALGLRRKKLTRMYFFILHLCVADLIVAFLHVLPQLCWDATHRFQGNDFLCKTIKFGQLLGPYLSAYILVAMAIDRYLAICFPLNAWAVTHSKTMVFGAWAVSIILSSPQIFLFNYEFIGGAVNDWDCWVRFTEQEQKIYVTAYIVANTLIPLSVLCFTYTAICWAVWRNFKHKNENNLNANSGKHLHENGDANKSVNPRSHSLQRISRAKIKTVKLTVVVITCYIVCAMPYTCVMLWITYDSNASNTAFYNGWLFPLLVLVASLNSCVNPWVYLAFNKTLAQSLTLCCQKDSERRTTRTMATTFSRTSFSESAAAAVTPRIEGTTTSTTSTSVQMHRIGCNHKDAQRMLCPCERV